jgi:hypothetical protein
MFWQLTHPYWWVEMAWISYLGYAKIAGINCKQILLQKQLLGLQRYNGGTITCKNRIVRSCWETSVPVTPNHTWMIKTGVTAISTETLFQTPIRLLQLEKQHQSRPRRDIDEAISTVLNWRNIPLVNRVFPFSWQRGSITLLGWGMVTTLEVRFRC